MHRGYVQLHIQCDTDLSVHPILIPSHSRCLPWKDPLACSPHSILITGHVLTHIICCLGPGIPRVQIFLSLS